MSYKHTQIGWVIIGSFLLMGVIMFSLGAPWPVYVLVVIIDILFISLTVAVDNQNVDIAFGPGLIRRRFAIKDIESCRITPVRCWSWGIHGWGKRWLYNVSGFSSIELKMKNGAVNYIGTDDPIELDRTVNQRLNGVQ